MIFRTYFLHRLINFFLALISWLFKQMFNANWETSFKTEYHLFSTISLSLCLFLSLNQVALGWQNPKFVDTPPTFDLFS